MLKRISFVFLFAISFIGEIHAQKSWWVFFTDKNNTTFDPYSYFSPEAIFRRQKLGISLYDSTDFPVNENYISLVRISVNQLGHVTRWFNGVGVDASDEEVAVLRKLPFVREVVPQTDWDIVPAFTKLFPDTTIEDDYGKDRNLKQQIDPLQGKYFSEHNLKGNGIIISVIDVGFHGVDNSPAFLKMRFNNRIRSTYDFAKDVSDVYNSKADHGTMVLSCIAGFANGAQMGLAPDATFLLAKISTNLTNQTHGEENFVAAVEWSDKQGAMIINCSDGPDENSYFPEQMNGKISLMSRTSNMAASKGILVVVAAGNEGETSQPQLLPPAEADSVLSVTALNDDGIIASYSSYGPPPDFGRKPDVSAPGTAIVANGDGGYEVAEGTSFSAPLLVGFAACIIEKYPDLSPMMLIDSMRRCSSHYPYYDYSHGYGEPQASYFFDSLKVAPSTFTFIKKDEGETIKINENSMPDCRSHKSEMLFYSLEDSKGRIYRYEVINIKDDDHIEISLDDLKVGTKLHVFYKNYYATESF
ncbi:MAG: S8 family serine peptidase [Bacteroidetes bacterium]|nr:S8 family serine peptidase [Bacteroidota bacterium]